MNLLYIGNQFRGFGLNQLFSPRINSDITNTLTSISRTQFESVLFIAYLVRIMTHSRNHDGMLT